MYSLTEQNIFIFLIQVFLLLGSARVAGELFSKLKQPPLTAEIIVGIILGPTILGRFFPQAYQFLFPKDIIQSSMLETVAWLGILFLLLESGLEMDFSSAWRQRGNALRIALADIILPFILGFIVFLFLPAHYLVNPHQRIIFAVFMAAVVTISAMPVVVRALHDLRLSKTDLGFLIMSALSVNDIMGWFIFTLVLGIFSHASIDVIKIFSFFFLITGFTVLVLTLGRNFANYFISKIQSKHMPEPATSLTFICLLGVLCGAITQKIGINALFGFFVAGIMAGEARALSERTRQVISQMVYAIFVPLFFVGIGLKMDFLRNFDIFLVILLSTVAIGGKFLGAWLGVNFARVEKSNRLPVAIAHTPGGVMEIVFGLIALQYHLITGPIFVAIVFSAVISSVIFGPWLSHAIRKRKEISVLEFFSRRTIIAELATGERDVAIRKLCEMVGEQEGIADKEILYSRVLKRENSMGTALEEGVAIPHARL